MMTLLEWKNDYKTGVISIDYEHEQLILTINRMFDKTTKGSSQRDHLLDSLSEVHALIEAHFALEEKIMRDVQYSDYAPHKKDHDDLLEDIREIMDDVETGRETDVKTDLKERMSSWFGTHFATLDRDFHIKLGY